MFFVHTPRDGFSGMLFAFSYSDQKIPHGYNKVGILILKSAFLSAKQLPVLVVLFESLKYVNKWLHGGICEKCMLLLIRIHK